MQAWDVYQDGNIIDTVWYDSDCDEHWVLDGLINHDGYAPDIQVVKA